MTEVFAAIVGIIGTVVVSVFTYFMARKAGIGPYQDTLVNKLKDLIEVQEKEIAQLQQENRELRERVTALEKSVAELTKLTVAQALQLQATHV